jgi:hypothetical protein
MDRADIRRRLPRVAEAPAVYGVAEAEDEVFETMPAPCAWPAPGELAALRRKVEHAIADLARGRQAAGVVPLAAPDSATFRAG